MQIHFNNISVYVDGVQWNEWRLLPSKLRRPKEEKTMPRTEWNDMVQCDSCCWFNTDMNYVVGDAACDGGRIKRNENMASEHAMHITCARCIMCIRVSVCKRLELFWSEYCWNRKWLKCTSNSRHNLSRNALRATTVDNKLYVGAPCAYVDGTHILINRKGATIS